MSSGLVTGVFGVLHLGNSSRSELPQALVIVFAFIGVSLLAFIWAAFFRRQGRRHRHHHHHHHDHDEEKPARNGNLVSEEKKESSGHHHHRRRRRRSREHRPRNPTLAEAGGLPPVRPDDVPPPGP